MQRPDRRLGRRGCRQLHQGPGIREEDGEHPCGLGSDRKRLRQRQQQAALPGQAGRWDGHNGSSSPTGTAGIITSVATNNGKAWNVVSDALANVYGTTATSGTGVTKSGAPATPPSAALPWTVATAWGCVTRSAAAQTAGVWTMSASGATSGGLDRRGLVPTGPQLDVATKLFIDCPGEQRHHAGTTRRSKRFRSSSTASSTAARSPCPTPLGFTSTTPTPPAAPVNAAVVSLSNNTGFCVRRDLRHRRWRELPDGALGPTGPP